MTREQLAALLELATTALADLAAMAEPKAVLQVKARRVYREIREQWHGPGPDDDADATPKEPHQ